MTGLLRVNSMSANNQRPVPSALPPLSVWWVAHLLAVHDTVWYIHGTVWYFYGTVWYGTVRIRCDSFQRHLRDIYLLERSYDETLVRDRQEREIQVKVQKENISVVAESLRRR